VSRLRDNLVPPAGIPRRLSTQNLLFGIGRGAFETGSAVYFLQMVGLQAWEIGLGLSISAGVAMLSAVHLSGYLDRFNPRSSWLAGVLLSAALFALYPLVHGFWGFTLLVSGLQLALTISGAGRNVYMIEALEPETRVITQAFGRSWMNIGWGAGAAAAGAALAIDTPAAYHAMVYVNVTVMVINALMISRLPGTAHDTVTRARHSKRVVFKDRPYIAVSGVLAVLSIHGTVSLEVAPLWMILHTDAPKWILAAVTGVNTVMATTMQVAMTRGSHTIAGGRRVLRWAAWIGAACCPLFYLSGLTNGLVTIGVLVLATILVTMSELWQSAAAWTLAAELAPDGRKGEYLGAGRMLYSAQHMIAPGALIALAVTTGGWGWIVISAIFVVAGLFGSAAVDWATRTRPRPASSATVAEPADSAAGPDGLAGSATLAGPAIAAEPESSGVRAG
jgi:MFS family permease